MSQERRRHGRDHGGHEHPDDAGMLSVEEARERVFSYLSVLSSEERPLLEAVGQVLSEDLRATFPVPPVANSAMDGYAVRREDVAGASRETPVVLPVQGTVAAGEMPGGPVAPGTAVRIMTGAPVPEGATAVVPFENTDEVERREAGREPGRIGILVEPRQDANIRFAGEDVEEGSVVLAKGRRLRPADVGVAASMGLAVAPVVRRPVVAIISTGDEILEPGEPREPGKIYDSNAFSLAASVAECGGVPRVLGRARDTMESLNAMIDRALDADLVLTSAGVSRGDYDVVKNVLAARGHIALHTVRMQPARPLAFGAFRGPGGRDVPHLGLPGNPVAVLVAFELFARPAINLMMGRTPVLDRPMVRATLDDPIRNREARRVFARVVVYRDEVSGGYRARLSGSQGSGVLTAMAEANGLAICPEEVPGLQPGDVATVQLLEWVTGEG